jgi:glycosyltransferase involved in cell wall biosynthesis
MSVVPPIPTMQNAVQSDTQDARSVPVRQAKIATAGRRLTGKRVGMVVYSAYPADPRPRRAADALLQEGAAVDLICEGDGKAPARETMGALTVTRIPIPHRRGGALAYAYEYSSFILLSAGRFAWRTLRRRYDLIYVHNMPDILVLTGLFPRIFGAKIILDQHDPMPELMRTIFGLDEASLAVRVIQRLEKWSIARADLVITVNIACQRLFAARSCRREKIGVVMNAPDDRIFGYREAGSYDPPAPNKPFTIMYHGSLVERNGLQLAVDALATVRESIPATQLLIYGKKTPYLDQVLAKVSQLGLESQVRYLGPRTLEQLVHEIESCDVGVVPNPRNTFTEINTPTRIFEYLSLGKPVIAPRTAGIEDYFSADSLMFFEPGDSLDLARQIRYAAQHRDEAVSVAERGQKVYAAHRWQQERETLVELVVGLLRPETAR